MTTTTMNEAVALEVIRTRTTQRFHHQRPSHARTSRVLRRMAEHLDRG